MRDYLAMIPNLRAISMRVPSWKIQRDPVLATLMVDYDVGLASVIIDILGADLS
jgi:hypothetical protein